MPQSVTYVLNLKCHLCPEPVPSGAQGDGGLLPDIGENLTNEANLCENASTSAIHESFQVTANFDEVLGLDSLETKPAGDWGGEGGLDEEEGVSDEVSGGDCDEEVGTRRAEDGFGGLGGGGLVADIGENVTNEANLCENASTSEIHKSVQVTANSDGILGLDNLETKPADEGGTCRAEGGGRRAEEILGTEERGGGTEDGRRREGDEAAQAGRLDGVLADRMAKIKAHFWAVVWSHPGAVVGVAGGDGDPGAVSSEGGGGGG